MALKFHTGALIGGISGIKLGNALSKDEGDGDNAIGAAIAFSFGLTVGSVVGTAVGVSLFEPQDRLNRFVISLVGSLLGCAVGWYHSYALGFNDVWPIYVYPSVSATIASEWSRWFSASPEVHRLSVGLAPMAGKGVSAVADIGF